MLHLHDSLIALRCCHHHGSPDYELPEDVCLQKALYFSGKVLTHVCGIDAR
jgi:hypothetical protein